MMKNTTLTFLLCALVLSACGAGATPEPTTTPQESAWYACTTFIQQQLGLSPSDAQRYTASGVTTLEDNQFRVEVYYANQGDTYRCKILHRFDGNWELQGLEVK